MPLLVALDEYDGAIQCIAAHAQLALAAPEHQEAALQLILSVCQKTDETVEDVLRYAGPACFTSLDADVYLR
ncbi:MAG: hypothetical protein EPN31_04420 [Castellaniella sp.]|uniref:hypothetical protein n=1 Tax=Castellaniella sp. TaxID=1955812 RepID=UPI00121748DD|nr:hypothetical protein [Castellaniella sp.]TAN30324.1 MAG: hypothetical protein EPN31_04420 [Castellaniella sp.]